MIESLEVIRGLHLATVFEDLFLGRPVSPAVRAVFNYPQRFRGARLADWEPLTAGGSIPIVDNGNFDQICLFDPGSRTFILKAVEEPVEIEREFGSWQQYLAVRLLEIADSGADDDQLSNIAAVVGFRHRPALLEVLRAMEGAAGDEINRLGERFIRACSDDSA